MLKNNSIIEKPVRARETENKANKVVKKDKRRKMEEAC